jgi:DNA mismatch repair ATPase MutS
VNLALHHLNRREAQELSEVVVTNDVHMGAEGRVYILTGPNQGGKTTYTQAVGLTQIMTQTGLYVPGEGARISPVYGIYTHYPLEEELEKGTGRLGDETQRLNVLFSQVTRHSLVLLNESLSSTAPGESLYLARDVVRVLRLLGARAIFVTHLHQLAADAESLNAETPGDSRIVSMVASLIEEDEGSHGGDSRGIRRTYKVVPNPPMGRSYAMEIARRYGISYEQLKEALAERGVLKTSS